MFGECASCFLSMRARTHTRAHTRTHRTHACAHTHTLTGSCVRQKRKQGQQCFSLSHPSQWCPTTAGFHSAWKGKDKVLTVRRLGDPGSINTSKWRPSWRLRLNLSSNDPGKTKAQCLLVFVYSPVGSTRQRGSEAREFSRQCLGEGRW